MDGHVTLTFDVKKNPEPVSAPHRETLLKNPGFGKALDLDLATMVLRYALDIFEGIKVYRLPDGGATLFRPDANACRFRDFAERLAMGRLPEDVFIESCRALVRLDRDWIPSAEGGSLYLRPFLIGSEAALGTKAGFRIRVLRDCISGGVLFQERIRSGDTLAIGKLYKSCTRWNRRCQVRWQLCGQPCGADGRSSRRLRSGSFLDVIERRWVEELGGMNIFFVFEDGSLQTPPLTGTILPDITRNSLIQIGRDMGLTVKEEPYAVDQWQKDVESGRLHEAFACGTAAVVTRLKAALTDPVRACARPSWLA